MNILMTYDLEANGDGNLNNDIKERLLSMGWCDGVNYYVERSGIFVKDRAPSTTLWKKNCTSPQESSNDFVRACQDYNKSHQGRQANGKVWCIEIGRSHHACIFT